MLLFYSFQGLPKVVIKRRQGDEEFEVLKERPGAWVGWEWVYVHVRSQTQLLKARHMNERRGGSAVLAVKKPFILVECTFS